MLGALPADFRAEFSEEMAEVFGKRLAASEEQGIGAMVVLGRQELGQMPLALLRLHLYRWQKKRKRAANLFSQMQGHSLFGVPPADNDGRFSRLHLSLEMSPFLLAAGLILLLTYQPLAWLPSKWRDPLDVAAVWAGALPLLALLLGVMRGMPRWAFPYAGLVAGYTLWAAAEQRLVWLWSGLLVTAVFLAVMAVIVQRGERPLPPFLQQIGTSAALDWTRLSFGVFGAAPLLILAAFDNARLNDTTPYLALALLLMVLTALVYGRCQRQDRQLAALVIGATLLFVPALLDNLHWRGGWSDVGWLVALWAWMVTLLLLPLLSAPVRWISLHLSLAPGNNE